MTSTPYLDSALAIEARVADLLTRMTLTAKCAQLIGPFGLDEGDGQLSLNFVECEQLNYFQPGTEQIRNLHI